MDRTLSTSPDKTKDPYVDSGSDWCSECPTGRTLWLVLLYFPSLTLFSVVLYPVDHSFRHRLRSTSPSMRYKAPVLPKNLYYPNFDCGFTVYPIDPDPGDGPSSSSYSFLQSRLTDKFLRPGTHPSLFLLPRSDLSTTDYV